MPMELRSRKLPTNVQPQTRPRQRRSRAPSTTSIASTSTMDAASEPSERAAEPAPPSSATANETQPLLKRDAVNPLRRVLAWSVHLYTGLGLLINAYSLHTALYGAKPNFELFARLNWLAIFVDATDGTLARRFDVKRLAAGMDGALLDNIIDFQTFSLLPALGLIVFEEMAQSIKYAIAASVLIASGYQFCQATAKTDAAFVGFPSYWNVLLFYVHYLKPPVAVTAALFGGCAILSFVPIHFIYPTRTPEYFKWTIGGAYIWGMLMLVPTLMPGSPYARPAMQLSLLYVVYYLALSLVLDARRRKSERIAAAANGPTPQNE